MRWLKISVFVFADIYSTRIAAQVNDIIQAQKWVGAGKQYLASKQYTKAEKAFANAARIYKKHQAKPKLAVTYFYLAKTAYYRRYFDQALKYGKKSLRLFKGINDQKNIQIAGQMIEAISRTKWKTTGIQAFNQKHYDLARKAFLKALQHSGQTPFEKGEMNYFLANSYLSLNRADSAAYYSEKACTIFGSLLKKNKKTQQCRQRMKNCLLLQAKLYADAENFNQAANALTALFNDYAGTMTPSEKKENLRNLISFYLSAGRTKEALSVTENLAREDSTLSGIYSAYIYEQFGKSDQALKALQKAHEKYRQEKDETEDILCLKQIWPIQFNQGKYSEASGTLDSLLSYKKNLSPNDYLNVLKAKLLIAQMQGKPAEGEALLSQFKKELKRFNQDLSSEKKAYFDLALAEIYTNFGLIDSALTVMNAYKRVVPSSQSIPLKLEYYKTYGQIMATREQYEKAIASFKQAYQIALANNAKNDLIQIVIDLGNINLGLGAENDALRWYWKALALLKEVPSPSDLITCYTNIANIYFNVQKSDSAIVYYQKSIDLAEKQGSPVAIWENYDRMAHLLEIRGDSTSAMENYKKALEFCTQSGQFSRKTGHKPDQLIRILQLYDKIIDLSYKTGNKQEGDHFRKKKKNFLDNNRALISDLMAMRKGTGSLTAEQIALLKGADSDRNAPGKSGTWKKDALELSKVSDDIAEMQKTFNQKVDEIKFIYGDQLPRYMAISPEQLNALQPYLPEDVLLLSFFPADDKLFIFAIERKYKKIFEVDLSRKKLYRKLNLFKKKIGNFQSLLASRNQETENINQYKDQLTEFQKISLELYSDLFAQVKNIIGEGIKNIQIIPSGWLYYVPFQALIYRVDQTPHYLIEKYNFTYQNANTALATLTRNPFRHHHYSILAFGNPDGSLPNAAEEVQAIHKEFPESSTIFLGKDASEKALFENSGNFNILHFATHARLNIFNTLKSYILLAPSPPYDGKLTREDIYKLDLSSVELVTLSACETAVGEKVPKSEVENIANAFLRRNVSSVVASLWPVSDVSTKELMLKFYANLKTKSKSEALREAQLYLLKNTYYNNPYYWAGFILMGDWR